MMRSSELLFQYYQSIMPEPGQWSRVVNQPLSVSGWVNPLKTSYKKVADSLSADGFIVERMPWHPLGFLILSQPYALGLHWTFRTGLIHIQEAVSMLAGQVLRVAPGDRVLDLCCAPGNKSVQLAIQLDPCGTLVANDKNYSRMRALGQMLVRLGLANITTTVHDGTQFPGHENTFDAILVDAPCSCEGTFRKNLKKVVKPNRDYSNRLSCTQELLLRKALHLVRPGGKILYSTCTFAPEENEAVVDRVLKRSEGMLRVLPFDVSPFKASEGLTEWRGKVFDNSLKLTRRAWPHLNNTGGFYWALLEKVGASSAPVLVPESQTSCSAAQPYVQEVIERFGFPADVFDDFVFLENGSKGFHIAPKDHYDFPEMRSDAMGLFFLKTKIRHPKLSSGAVMRWGGLATRHVIALSPEQRDVYLAREDLPLSADQVSRCESLGYVVVMFEEVVLGLGLYFPEDENHGRYLRSLFPKRL